jgi:membrane protein implicated in regulation of membrane protease activity
MEAWHWWLIAAIILITLEIFTCDFLLATFGIACLGGCLAAVFGAEFTIQLAVFVAASIVVLSFVRPAVLRQLHRSSENFPTNVDGVAGQTGTVTTTVGGAGKPGRVKIGGEEWRAISQDGETLDEGLSIEVVSVDSATVFVRLKA